MSATTSLKTPSSASSLCTSARPRGPAPGTPCSAADALLSGGSALLIGPSPATSRPPFQLHCSSPLTPSRCLMKTFNKSCIQARERYRETRYLMQTFDTGSLQPRCLSPDSHLCDTPSTSAQTLAICVLRDLHRDPLRPRICKKKARVARKRRPGRGRGGGGGRGVHASAGEFEGAHSPHRRAAEDAPTTAEHDVPRTRRWARGR